MKIVLDEEGGLLSMENESDVVVVFQFVLFLVQNLKDDKPFDDFTGNDTVFRIQETGARASVRIMLWIISRLKQITYELGSSIDSR